MIRSLKNLKFRRKRRRRNLRIPIYSMEPRLVITSICKFQWSKSSLLWQSWRYLRWSSLHLTANLRITGRRQSSRVWPSLAWGKPQQTAQSRLSYPMITRSRFCLPVAMTTLSARSIAQVLPDILMLAIHRRSKECATGLMKNRPRRVVIKTSMYQKLNAKSCHSAKASRPVNPYCSFQTFGKVNKIQEYHNIGSLK